MKRLGLLHWGDAMIDILTDVKRPMVFSIGDIYRLSEEDLAICTSGAKMARKCHQVLHLNKRISLELFIASLNIPLLALSTATDIVAAGFDTVDKILEITYDDLVKIQNIGEKTARQVFDGLQEKRSVIIDLASVLSIVGPIIGPLTGMSFCITGATSKPRKDVHKDIMGVGGIVKESVGKGLTYLVTNELSQSSKSVKAQKYGTRVITEAQLYEMMEWPK